MGGYTPLDSTDVIRFSGPFSVFKLASTKMGLVCLFFLFIIAFSELVIGSYSGLIPSFLMKYITVLNKTAFRDTLIKFVYYTLLSVSVTSLKIWVSDRLCILMRKKISEELHDKYMRENAFYDLLIRDSQIDNPDARITQDVANWAQSFVSIITKLTQTPSIVIYYSYLTYKDFSWKALIICYLFTLLSFFISKLVMKPLIKLTYLFEKANGDFRLAHISLKENAETVALSQGQNTEAKLLSNRLSQVIGYQKQLANKSTFMNAVTNSFQYFGNGLVYLCIYLCANKSLDPSTLAEFTSRVSFEVIMLIMGLTSIMDVMQSYSKLCGYSARIKELQCILDEHKNLVDSTSFGDHIEFDNVSIKQPSGNILIQDLSLSIEKGCSVFVTGPSGSGKSSLFRVLGHVWPTTAGKVITPVSSPSSLILLSQHPYLPLSSLVDAISFPLESTEVSIERVNDAMRFMGISHLALRPKESWYVGLSPGEKQRIALCRILVHRPSFALLDEATSAIPRVLEEAIFMQFMKYGITCITIAHNRSLKRFHAKSLKLQGEGEYRIE